MTWDSGACWHFLQARVFHKPLASFPVLSLSPGDRSNVMCISSAPTGYGAQGDFLPCGTPHILDLSSFGRKKKNKIPQNSHQYFCNFSWQVIPGSSETSEWFIEALQQKYHWSYVSHSSVYLHMSIIKRVLKEARQSDWWLKQTLLCYQREMSQRAWPFPLKVFWEVVVLPLQTSEKTWKTKGFLISSLDILQGKVLRLTGSCSSAHRQLWAHGALLLPVRTPNPPEQSHLHPTLQHPWVPVTSTHSLQGKAVDDGHTRLKVFLHSRGKLRMTILKRILKEAKQSIWWLKQTLSCYQKMSPAGEAWKTKNKSGWISRETSSPVLCYTTDK